ncbi:MAG TPA: hypothetical protein VK436_13485 [Methanocella sp.]|nr:hypothetical protein [Methanocella sp.]
MVLPSSIDDRDGLFSGVFFEDAFFAAIPELEDFVPVALEDFAFAAGFEAALAATFFAPAFAAGLEAALAATFFAPALEAVFSTAFFVPADFAADLTVFTAGLVARFDAADLVVDVFFAVGILTHPVYKRYIDSFHLFNVNSFE